MMTKKIMSLENLDAIAGQLWQLHQQCSIYTFSGPLGVGKTTVVRALLKQAGINQPVTSPTFTYVNIYKNGKGQLFNHFDLYRITSMDQFLEQGFDEFLYAPNSWCFIEWPELIMSLLTHKVCHVQIDYHDQERILNYRVIL